MAEQRHPYPVWNPGAERSELMVVWPIVNVAGEQPDAASGAQRDVRRDVAKLSGNVHATTAGTDNQNGLPHEPLWPLVGRTMRQHPRIGFDTGIGGDAG